jgi:hypothetical protein
MMTLATTFALLEAGAATVAGVLIAQMLASRKAGIREHHEQDQVWNSGETTCPPPEAAIAATSDTPCRTHRPKPCSATAPSAAASL